ncbi:MAG: sigma-70 family RNA polymerase sigma factor [Burkholderiaceae bacterium]|nr:sigma-70 family RNA polymerase sigma factor [Burkholderiaceae bacterium]
MMRYQRLVHTIARRAGLDEAIAADVFQEVFARLLRHLDTLREPQRLQAWIVTTAKREALHQRARARREIALDEPPADRDDDATLAPQLVDPGPLPDELLDELQQLERLQRGVERLDERCRALIGALYRDDAPPAYEVIAVRLAMPVGSIGPTRARCLDRLRRLLLAG